MKAKRSKMKVFVYLLQWEMDPVSELSDRSVRPFEPTATPPLDQNVSLFQPRIDDESREGRGGKGAT